VLRDNAIDSTLAERARCFLLQSRHSYSVHGSVRSHSSTEGLSEEGNEAFLSTASSFSSQRLPRKAQSVQQSLVTALDAALRSIATILEQL
jgi:hypothetical protein